jgi:pyruvate/2-oxoglutarate dehydrogenase complex dihydrolipoamide acyltransferase (E2) component
MARPALRAELGQDRWSAADLVKGNPRPMATEVLLPKIGFAMNEGQVTEWLVQDGGTVTEGQPLFALEAEKSANEVEAPASGVLRIVQPAGDTYSVGTLLAVIE